MKKLLIAGVALSMLGASVAPALAQGRGEIRHDRQELRQDRRELRQDVRDHRRWARGQRLPRQYWGSQYYVNDWRARRLPPPRAGYRWVRRDNDYLMIAATTGLIASVVAASR